MEILPGGYTLKLYEGCFPLSTDSMALAHFVRLPKNAQVLDLGAGCGTLGLLLCAGRSDCHITGIELSTTAHEGAMDNIARNGLGHRMESICGDLRNASLIQASKFDVCVSNPPYFSGGPAAKLKEARRTDLCSMEALMNAAGKALKFGGDFFLVHRPEALGQLFICVGKAAMEPKRLCLLRHRPDAPVSLVLVQCRKGAKPGLIWEELCLHDSTGAPTEEYKRIYHLEEA